MASALYRLAGRAKKAQIIRELPQDFFFEEVEVEGPSDCAVIFETARRFYKCAVPYLEATRKGEVATI